MKFAIGADIGGSHISCAAIELKNEKLLKESFSEANVNNKASAEEILRRWAIALLSTIEHIGKKDIEGICFAMPGPFNYEKGIALFKGVEKYEALYGINVEDRLRELLRLDKGIPFRFMNDATAFSVGEAWLGKAAGYRRAIAITLGTGFGSAFLDSGIPVVNRDDVPKLGCLWHLPYKDGIADDYFSTRWYEKNYSEKTKTIVSGVREIALRANEDIIAKQLFIEFGTNLGNFLWPWVQKFSAEVLVIGGNVLGALNLFGPALESTIKAHGLNILIVPSELKETAAIIGAAKLAKEDYWTQLKPLLKYM